MLSRTAARLTINQCIVRNSIQATSARAFSTSVDGPKIDSERIITKKPSMIKTLSELSKLRLSSLVVCTTAAGFIAAGGPIDYVTMFSACIGTGLCAASASTLNQVFEIKQDLLMKRTRARPLPTGRLTPTAAVGWSALTASAGVGLLYAATNPCVAGLGLANIALYSGAYTYSKRVSEWNTWIGSVVGAIPPVMGYAAAAHGEVFAPVPMALASLLLLWQFPHFFALSWLCKEDYTNGGFQMVSVNDPTGKRTARLIMEYSVYMTMFPWITTATGLTNYMFAVEGTVLNGFWLAIAYNFYRDRTDANAKKVFLHSLWYLPLLIAGFVVYLPVWNESEDTVKQTDAITKSVLSTKEKLKGICVHEMITNSDSNKPHLCAKLATDKAVESSTSNVQVVVEKTSSLVEKPDNLLRIQESDNQTEEK